MAAFRPRLDVRSSVPRNMQIKNWSGRPELNRRPLGPEFQTPAQFPFSYLLKSKELFEFDLFSQSYNPYN